MQVHLHHRIIKGPPSESEKFAALWVRIHELLIGIYDAEPATFILPLFAAATSAW